MSTKDRYRGMSLIFAAALALSGCGDAAGSGVQEEVSAIAVKAASPQVGTLTVSNEFVGTVTPQQEVSVIPLVSGVIDGIYAEVGDEVQAGDVLFHIEDEAARLQQESAEMTKRSAEVSARAQLGSAQVLNNISMESNIRSIEFQIETAKDQYNSAVNGVQDAEDAKAEMEDALDGINDSIDSLRGSQKEMKSVIEQAGDRDSNGNYRYIDQTGLASGEWKNPWPYSGTPDDYDWSRDSEEAPEEEGEDDSSTPPADFTLPDIPVNSDGGSAISDSEEPPAETEPESTEPEKTGSASETESPAETESAAGSESPAETGDGATSAPKESVQASGGDDPAGEPGGTGGDNSGESPKPSAAEGPEQGEGGDPADGGSMENDSMKNGSAENGSAENGSGKTDSPEKASPGEAGFGAYFAVELVREAEPVYLADNGGADPTAAFDSEEKAWAAYNEQKKIDQLKRKTDEMGFTASDIVSGRAETALAEYDVQIVALEYQASQIESNQASLDSSIKSAESARDTTGKTIDFYEDNLKDAQTSYGITNGQAYQDTADALATQIGAADVGVRSAQLQLEYYSPTTPISGTVVSRTVDLYDMAQPGYAAYVISNQDAMNVTFSVSGQVRETLQIGMPVTLEKDGKTFAGSITEIGATVDAQTGGLFTVKAVTEAGGDQLAGGSAVKLSVDTFRTDDAVLVPYDAVHFESGQAYVFEIVDGAAVRTPVTIGLTDEDTAEITEGLDADSRIVETWSSQLEDGAKVRVIGEEEE